MSHPKDRIPPLSRREFLRRAAMTGVAVPGLAAILAACGSDDGSAGGASGSSPTAAGLQLARPDDPVTLAITEDNPAIADGLSPEAGPLKIFGYNDYVWKKVRNQFSDRYGVDVEYTVFDTPDEMVSKMQSNGSDFDILVTVTLENVGKLAQGGLIQPLNKTYLPTFEDQLWTGIPDFYDVGRQYSAPYVVFTTGISWRNDLITDDIGAMDNPYDIFWDTANKGQVHLLNGVARHAGDSAAPRRLRPERRTIRRSWTRSSRTCWTAPTRWGGSTTTWTTPSSARTAGRCTARGPGRWSITSTTCRRAWTSRRSPTRGRRRASACEARPDLARPVRHLEGRRQPGAGAQVHRLHVRAGQRAHRTTPTRATSPPCCRSTSRRRWTRAICRPAWTTRS